MNLSHSDDSKGNFTEMDKSATNFEVDLTKMLARGDKKKNHT